MKKVSIKLKTGRTIEIVRVENPKPPRGIATVLRLKGDKRPVEIDEADEYEVVYKDGTYTTQGYGKVAGKAYRRPSRGLYAIDNDKAAEGDLGELSDFLHGRVYDISLRSLDGETVSQVKSGLGVASVYGLPLRYGELHEVSDRGTEIRERVAALGEITQEGDRLARSMDMK